MTNFEYYKQEITQEEFIQSVLLNCDGCPAYPCGLDGIIDALNQASEEYLVSVEEIASALKIMNNRMKEFLDSGRKLSEKDWERIFNNLKNRLLYG